MASIFKDDGKYLYLDIDYAEFYIPMYYFENKWARELSDTIQSFAVFNIGIFEGGNLKEMRLLNIPSQMDFYAYDTEKRVVNMEGSPSTPCLVLKYIKGQKIMEDAMIENSDNAAMFLDMILKGKIPSTVPYTKVLQLWMANQDMNKINFGVPSSTLEMILGVCYRDKNDISQKFATVIGKNPNVSPYDYSMANIRKICQYGSTFTAMTFEDINSMITVSVNRTRDKRSEMESPMEKIIKF